MKIAIIGYSGSGKSTLAKKLGVMSGAPVLHLDRVHWLPGWQERPREEELAMVTQFLNENGAWIIDGNYSALEYQRRMEEADHIIFMAFNRMDCFGRTLRRVARHRGESRPSMADGCNEKLDAGFAWWILHEGRNRARKERYDEVVAAYPEKTLVLKNQRELDAFVANIQPTAKPEAEHANA
ncbi:MAG: DNA topology modulation protein FlaR [Faecalibacterium sp.]|nr:DNA topology modulation protein FlaR [Faecalibacterium sp.]